MIAKGLSFVNERIRMEEKESTRPGNNRGKEMKEIKEGKCILVAAGDLTVAAVSKEPEDLCIAVDGGLAYCGLLELEPDLIIGDFDSLGESELEAVEVLEEKIPDRIVRLPREKDDTDMMAAIRRGLEAGYRSFRIYGACGGRLDHMFANLQCLVYLKNHDAVGYLIDGGGMILAIQNECVHFKAGLEGTLSLFAMSEEVRGVTIRGMKYNITDTTIQNDYPIGISNEFTGQEASVEVQSGTLIAMISYAE